MIWMSPEMKLWDDLIKWHRQRDNEKRAIQYGELSKIMRAEDYGMKEWEPSIETTTGFVKREPDLNAVIIDLRWVDQGNGLEHLCPFVSIEAKDSAMGDMLKDYANRVLDVLPMLYDKRETPREV